MPAEKLIEKIADRLVDIAYNDLTTAERQICKLLIDHGILAVNEDKPWRPVVKASSSS